MYSDIFEHLGGGSGGVGRGGAGTASAPEDKPLVSFKAGKIVLCPFQADRGTYACTADPSRGEVRLVCINNQLEWQWFDRRERKTMDRKVIVSSSSSSSTSTEEGGSPLWNFDKISPPLPSSTHKEDRVYVLTQHHHHDENSSSSSSSPTPSHPTYDLYWMQDADGSKDDEIVTQVNKYLSDPADAVAKATGSAGADASSSGRTGASTGAAGAAASSSSSQVDALSSILENLGMPHSSSSEASTPGEANAAAAARTLTLADLQGAMAGIQQQSNDASSTAGAAGLSLSDVVTPEAITMLLQDQAVCAHLMELLPEEQRSAEYLEENLRSPQVQQTLRALTSALLPDDAGHVDGFLSVLANFQLETSDAVMAASTNPIQAFLEAILRSVEKEKNEQEEEPEQQE